LLSQLKGKEFGVVNKSISNKKPKKDDDDSVYEIKLKEDKLLQNPFSTTKNKNNESKDKLSNNKKFNKNSENKNELESIVKTQLSKSNNKINEDVTPHAHVVYKVARFDKETTKEELEKFFSKILGKNLIKVKRLKDDNKEYTGIVLIEVKNTPEVEKLLFDKKYNHNNNRLKIKKFDI
jgi:hypothetical protein